MLTIGILPMLSEGVEERKVKEELSGMDENLQQKMNEDNAPSSQTEPLNLGLVPRLGIILSHEYLKSLKTEFNKYK